MEQKAEAPKDPKKFRIIEVVPIARGIIRETLSYYAAEPAEPGSVIEVPLRSKKIPALVVAERSAQDAKSEIKTADFELRKIEGLNARRLLRPEFIRAAEKSAEYFAGAPGAVLAGLIPQAILKEAAALGIPEEAPRTKGTVAEKFVVQSDDLDRFAEYRSLIRQEFAKKRSVFFCVPSHEEAKYALESLKKGIEDYAHLATGALTPKKQVEVWNKIMAEQHSVLIVGTCPFLSLPRSDIRTVILERESARSYKMQTRPYIDLRFFAETFAEAAGATFIAGDAMLRVETLSRYYDGSLVELNPLKFRSLSTAENRLIDMREYKKPGGSFKIVSEDVAQLIKANKEKNEHLFILTARRGFASSTVCGDCQNIVTCGSCSAPAVLHKSTKNGIEANFFLCHRCGERRSAEEVCKHCGSWRLATVGIGIELVEEKIRDKFPDIKVFRIDSDTATTAKAAEKIAQEYYSSPGSILVGTEMALFYLREKVENSAVVSLDSLFSVPDFRVNEKVFHLILRMRYLTSKLFILQTRQADQRVLEYGTKGNLIDFYREEVEERKKFGYPPFSTLIKVTIMGDRQFAIAEMDKVQKFLEPFQVDVFPAFTQTVRGQYVLHGLIKMKPAEWVDRDLLAKLRSLPPHVIVKVDPETLL